MTSKHTIFLLASTLLAGIVAAVMALAIVTGPAVSREMDKGRAGASEACEKATWPYIPAECLTRIIDGKPAPSAPVGSFTYARAIR